MIKIIISTIIGCIIGYNVYKIYIVKNVRAYICKKIKCQYLLSCPGWKKCETMQEIYRGAKRRIKND